MSETQKCKCIIFLVAVMTFVIAYWKSSITNGRSRKAYCISSLQQSMKIVKAKKRVYLLMLTGYTRNSNHVLKNLSAFVSLALPFIVLTSSSGRQYNSHVGAEDETNA